MECIINLFQTLPVKNATNIQYLQKQDCLTILSIRDAPKSQDSRSDGVNRYIEHLYERANPTPWALK